MNTLAFGVIGYLASKSSIAKVIFTYYLLYFSIYQLDTFANLTTDAWITLNLFIDLIVISLCYNFFVRKRCQLCLVYGVWVVIGYMLPELLSLNGFDAAWNTSSLMCIIDVIFAALGGVMSNENICYNGNNKHPDGTGVRRDECD